VSPGRASIYLLHATVRRAVERGLDLGSGSGIQALTMSRHCRQVVATDLNPLANALTRFNVALTR
jgi:methylase of polypeptide subunit release factors